ncbi:transposase [Actinomadura darangshiensis]|uniref:Transposase n=1 Tax=Actinomadura darangshiensis TaxID=705336 RepID=A0A4R5BNQ1_9ACTN|nr:RNA-guided endonuclease TnpB family protein [Actinomadura darangshiensis]TDD88488.1 transposase [Actinomadura darangshiensis]
MLRTETNGEPGVARYTYRLRLSGRTHKALLREWDRCRWVWNQCVVESRAANLAGEEIGPAALDRKLTGWRAAHGWLRRGASVPQQQIIRDFGRSRAKAIKDIQARLPMRQRVEMPRLKKRGLANPTLNYTRRGFRMRNRRLLLAGGIGVRVVWSRELPAEPSSVRVYRDSLGNWYASFVVPAQVEPLPVTGRAIGVDGGVKELATTTSDIHDLPHPQHGKTAAAKLARYQRQMARRRTLKGIPRSKGYKRAARRAARLHKRVQRQRQDTARKWAKQVVRDHDRIAVEDFRPRFLARSTMSRKAADAAIGAAKRELIDMGRKHGRLIVLVDPRNTTTDCASCGARTKHALPLSERTYSCTRCGVSRPRDKNSAHVMLVRAGFVPAGAEGVRPESPPGSEAT